MKKNISLVLCSLLVACGSYVKTSQQGEKIRVLEKNEVGTCKYLGQTSVSVLDKLAFIE